MTQIVSSISGIEIYAPSAGNAPTNSADVSAIASAYQVVSATGTQLYAGTAHVTSINGAPISASRAGNASNASLATSAWYDGTGRLISSLPDAATVSAIASSYADGKADASALSSYALSSDVSSTIDTVANNSASWGAGVSLPITGSVGTDSATYGETSVEFTRYDTAGEPDIRTASLSPDALNIMSTVDGNDYYSVNINENGIEFGDPDGYYSVNPSDISTWNSAVETVANNSATWGGGVQVVTATGSASATAVTGGYPPIGTSYLVSSINGSAILPYGYGTLSSNSAKWTSTNSAVSANSAKWTSTNSAVSANSANWNSVYNTVSNNSASWSGSTGGGSVTSPSGTIVVIGNQIEGTNSAVLTASSEQGFTTSFEAGVQIPSWTSQELYAGTLLGSGATLYIPTNTILGNTATAFISGRDSNMAIISASGLATEDPITIYLGAIVSNISARANTYIPINGDVTAEKEGGITVTGVGELAWKSAVDNVTNTVSSNSATWGQGGVDSATVSAIASGYAESAISSVSGNYYSTSNPAGYITGVDLSNYATTGYVDSSVSSKADSSALSSYALSADVSSTIDTVSSNSASWAQVVTSLSGNANFYNQINSKNISATVSYKARLDENGNSISALYDTVSAQSANWGGSALALSAGHGVKLEMSGSTLVASTDETVLWESAEGKLLAQGITLNESRLNFEMLRFYMGTQVGKSVISYDMPMYGLNRTQAFAIQPSMPFMDTAGTGFAINWEIAISATETSMSSVQALYWGKNNFGAANTASGSWTQGANNAGVPVVYKVIGINRTAGV